MRKERPLVYAVKLIKLANWTAVSGLKWSVMIVGRGRGGGKGKRGEERWVVREKVSVRR